MTTDRPDGHERSAAERERERRRLAEIFGDVLPDSTSDDLEDPSADGARGPGRAGDGGEGNARDAEILRDVPPHHA
jgi:hypothetical protein